MKYLIMFHTMTNSKDKFYIVFDIKGITKNEVKHYMEKFYSDLKSRGDRLDLNITWNDKWKEIKNYINYIDNLYIVKNEDLKDIRHFLDMKRYPYFDNMIKLNKEDVSSEFLKDYPELTIL